MAKYVPVQCSIILTLKNHSLSSAWQCVSIWINLIKGVNTETQPIFCRIIRIQLPLPQSECGSLPVLPLPLSSLYVAVYSLLIPADERGWKDPQKTTSKKSWPLLIYSLGGIKYKYARFSPVYLFRVKRLGTFPGPCAS